MWASASRIAGGAFVKSTGNPIKEGFIQEMLVAAARGSGFDWYCQSSLCSYGKGDRIAFLQEQHTIAEGVHIAQITVFLVDTQHNVRGGIVMKSKPNEPFNMITEMVVTRDGSLAAFTQAVTQRMFQSFWEMTECDLFVAKLKNTARAQHLVPAEEASDKIGSLPFADELAFLDDNTLLVVSID